MRHFRNIFFTLAAFLWLPVSAHCQLESLPGLEFLQCAGESPVLGGSTDCDDSGCCAAEKSHYQVSQQRVTIPAAEWLPRLLIALADDPVQLSGEVSTVALASVPPELSRGWQFVYRTASPPRAPSFAS